jgi:NAD(P)-dependent dehydrogenase (short-subunit alcohol dehydrogenase family)
MNTHRVWFITGASSGIGHELALAALRRGDKVAAVSRGPVEIPEALVLQADVRDEASVRAAVAATVDAFGRIDVLANNAGYGLFGAVEESTDAQARAVFDTNVFGVLNVLRAVLPIMRRQGSGHVLQGSSFYGQTAHAGVGMLSATKYAVEGLTDALLDELAPLGIHVTAIEPAPVRTPFLDNLDVASEIGDYDVSVRAVAQAIAEKGTSEFAPPAGIAAGILEAVDADVPPLRLALGSAAIPPLRNALRQRLQELEAWEAVTEAADRDPDIREVA